MEFEEKQEADNDSNPQNSTIPQNSGKKCEYCLKTFDLNQRNFERHKKKHVKKD